MLDCDQGNFRPPVYRSFCGYSAGWLGAAPRDAAGNALCLAFLLH